MFFCAFSVLLRPGFTEPRRVCRIRAPSTFVTCIQDQY
ncbi:Uncharacterised protein [Vibrio cholerae]|nr:Uncharacterised protein [Vibrio cholerae]